MEALQYIGRVTVHGENIQVDTPENSSSNNQPPQRTFLIEANKPGDSVTLRDKRRPITRKLTKEELEAAPKTAYGLRITSAYDPKNPTAGGLNIIFDNDTAETFTPDFAYDPVPDGYAARLYQVNGHKRRLTFGNGRVIVEYFGLTTTA